MWTEFLEAVDPKKGTAHCVCKHCNTVTRHPNHDAHKASSVLKKHLDFCLKYQCAKCEERQEYLETLPDFLLNFGDGEVRPMHGVMTSDKLCEQILHIICMGNLSFSQAENPELIGLLRHAYLNVQPPNRRSIASKLTDNTNLERENLKEELRNLNSKISLALDGWTTHGNLGFLGTNPILGIYK